MFDKVKAFFRTAFEKVKKKKKKAVGFVKSKFKKN